MRGARRREGVVSLRPMAGRRGDRFEHRRETPRAVDPVARELAAGSPRRDRGDGLAAVPDPEYSLLRSVAIEDDADRAATINGVGCERKVLLIDDNNVITQTLGTTFAELKYAVWCHGDFAIGPTSEIAGPIDVIVAEQTIGRTSIFSVLPSLRAYAPRARIAIVTAYPSVANAVRAMRMGCDAYLAKPVKAQCILQALSMGDDVAVDEVEDIDAAWPSLDRTVWEYINHVYTVSGSMSKAARRLRLDRRSLRRMLAKYPPLR